MKVDIPLNKRNQTKYFFYEISTKIVNARCDLKYRDGSFKYFDFWNLKLDVNSLATYIIKVIMSRYPDKSVLIWKNFKAVQNTFKKIFFVKEALTIVQIVHYSLLSK